jgi:predicted  nucleic acid-binding Zn-ribbon protein
MKIEATVQDIRCLLDLAELDARAPDLSPDTVRLRREASRQHLRRALADRYQTLFEFGRRPAVVAIERGACSGCHVRLPTMVEYQARHAPAVHVCPHCRRMLYAPELLAEKGPGTADC